VTICDGWFLDLLDRFIRQWPVAVYFKQLPETAGFLQNCRFFLPEISVYGEIHRDETYIHSAFFVLKSKQ
jgi:hypothetical protein